MSSKNTVDYEWFCEYCDQHDDIYDIATGGKKPGDVWPPCPCDDDQQYDHADLCLIRNFGNDDDGLLARGYAYVNDGVIDDTFCSGQKVPERFKKQLAKMFETLPEQTPASYTRIEVYKD